MPRAPRFTISVIGELFAQLEYAPAETRMRQMDAAERLIADIDPQQNYPDEFVIFRITGYRPDRSGESSMLVGRALRADLASLVLRLSHGLKLKATHSGRRAVAMKDAAAKLNVSTKTLQRYRKQGLAFHIVMFDGGMAREACFEDALARFVNGHADAVAKAGKFSRAGKDVEQRIVVQARAMRREKKRSLNDIAKALAKEHGRAHETIRQMLRRHDRRSARRIFTEPGPVDERIERQMYRAWMNGVELAALAKKYRKSKPTVLRAVNHRRAELLRGLTLRPVHLPTFDLPDAGTVILSSPAVRSALDDSWLAQDVLALVTELREADSPKEAHEHALVAGYNFLKHRAAMAIAGMAASPNSAKLDAIETDLRWAAMLKAKLARMGLPSALLRIEHNLHRPILQLPTDEIARLMRTSLQVVLRTVETVNPTRGQRLERAVAFAMDRELAKSTGLPDAQRASARHGAASGMTIEPAGGFVSWRWLIAPRAWRNQLQSLDEVQRKAVTLRHGVNGGPPMTVAQVARAMKVTSIRAARIVRAAEAALAGGGAGETRMS